MQTPLKNLRVSRSLSTYEVAQAVDIAQSHYSRVENGESQPSPALAAKLATYFGHAVSEMQILYPERYAAEEGQAA